MFRKLKKLFVVRVRSRRVRMTLTKAQYEIQKIPARELVEVYMQKHNGDKRFIVGKISIRNQSSRWGSCSPRGNLSFNVRLALLPAHLAEYIVVHELCHIKEHNHSVRFWSEVENILPDHKRRRGELRVWEKEQLRGPGLSTIR